MFLDIGVFVAFMCLVRCVSYSRLFSNSISCYISLVININARLEAVFVSSLDLNQKNRGSFNFPHVFYMNNVFPI